MTEMHEVGPQMATKNGNFHTEVEMCLRNSVNFNAKQPLPSLNKGRKLHIALTARVDNNDSGIKLCSFNENDN